MADIAGQCYALIDCYGRNCRLEAWQKKHGTEEEACILYVLSIASLQYLLSLSFLSYIPFLLSLSLIPHLSYLIPYSQDMSADDKAEWTMMTQADQPNVR